MDAFTWVSDNWVAICAAASTFVLAFDRLAKLTPAKKDDQAISKLYRLFALLGLKAKDNEGGR